MLVIKVKVRDHLNIKLLKADGWFLIWEYF